MFKSGLVCLALVHACTGQLVRTVTVLAFCGVPTSTRYPPDLALTGTTQLTLQTSGGSIEFPSLSSSAASNCLTTLTSDPTAAAHPSSYYENSAGLCSDGPDLNACGNEEEQICSSAGNTTYQFFCGFSPDCGSVLPDTAPITRKKKRIAVSSLAACVAACDRTPLCRAALYDDRTNSTSACRLYWDVTLLQPAARSLQLAIRPRAVASSSSSSSVARSSTSGAVQSQGASLAAQSGTSSGASNSDASPVISGIVASVLPPSGSLPSGSIALSQGPAPSWVLSSPLQGASLTSSSPVNTGAVGSSPLRSELEPGTPSTLRDLTSRVTLGPSLTITDTAATRGYTATSITVVSGITSIYVVVGPSQSAASSQNTPLTVPQLTLTDSTATLPFTLTTFTLISGSSSPIIVVGSPSGMTGVFGAPLPSSSSSSVVLPGTSPTTASNAVITPGPQLTITDSEATSSFISTILTVISGVTSPVVIIGESRNGTQRSPAQTSLRTVLSLSSVAGVQPSALESGTENGSLAASVSVFVSASVSVRVGSPGVTITDTTAASRFTSIVTTVSNGIATSIVVIGQPGGQVPSTSLAQSLTLTDSAATAPYTSTILTAISGVISPVVVIGQGSTIASGIPGSASSRNGNVGSNSPNSGSILPPASTQFDSAATSPYTSTITTAINGLTTQIVVVGGPGVTASSSLPAGLTLSPSTTASSNAASQAILSSVTSAPLILSQPEGASQSLLSGSTSGIPPSILQSTGNPFSGPSSVPLLTITGPSASLPYTSTSLTVVSGITSPIVVVGGPSNSAPTLVSSTTVLTITNTAEPAGFTSTSLTVVNGLTSPIVIVGGSGSTVSSLLSTTPALTITDTAASPGSTSTSLTVISGTTSPIVIVGPSRSITANSGSSILAGTITDTAATQRYTSTSVTVINSSITSQIIIIGEPQSTPANTGPALSGRSSQPLLLVTDPSATVSYTSTILTVISSSITTQIIVIGEPQLTSSGLQPLSNSLSPATTVTVINPSATIPYTTTRFTVVGGVTSQVVIVDKPESISPSPGISTSSLSAPALTLTDPAATSPYTSTSLTVLGSSITSQIVIVGQPQSTTITPNIQTSTLSSVPVATLTDPAATVPYTSTSFTVISNSITSQVVIIGRPPSTTGSLGTQLVRSSSGPALTITDPAATTPYTRTSLTVLSNSITSQVLVVGQPPSLSVSSGVPLTRPSSAPALTITDSAATALYTSTLRTVISSVVSDIVVIGQPSNNPVIVSNGLSALSSGLSSTSTLQSLSFSSLALPGGSAVTSISQPSTSLSLQSPSSIGVSLSNNNAGAGVSLSSTLVGLQTPTLSGVPLQSSNPGASTPQLSISASFSTPGSSVVSATIGVSVPSIATLPSAVGLPIGAGSSFASGTGIGTTTAGLVSSLGSAPSLSGTTALTSPAAGLFTSIVGASVSAPTTRTILAVSGSISAYVLVETPFAVSSYSTRYVASLVSVITVITTVLPSGLDPGYVLAASPYQLVTSYTAGTGSIATTISTILPGASVTSGYYLVETPASRTYFVTQFTPAAVLSATTISTILPPASGSPGTYLVATPYEYSSFSTSFSTGPVASITAVSTILPTAAGSNGVVVIGVPYSYSTLFTAGTGTTSRTVLTYISVNGTSAVPYVVVETPATVLPLLTSTIKGPGSVPTILSTITATLPLQTGVVVVQVPFSSSDYGTSFVPANTASLISIPRTISTVYPTGSLPYYIVETPANAYITSTSYGSSVTATQILATILPTTLPNGSVSPGTVVIGAPIPIVTSTTFGSDGLTATTTLTVVPYSTGPSGSVVPGTVVVAAPGRYVTSFVLASTTAGNVLPSVVTTIPPSLGSAGVLVPGTVVLQQVPSFVTSYTTISGISSIAVSTVAQASLQANGSVVPGTVVVAQPGPLVTRFTLLAASGTMQPASPTTYSLILPSVLANGTEVPGTVFLALPPTYTTAYTLITGIGTALASSIASASLRSDGVVIPGTVLVAQPGSYTTIYSAVTDTAAPALSTIAQPSIGPSGSQVPGTVVVKQLISYVTIYSIAGGATIPLTSTIATPSALPNGSQVPGTVVIVNIAQYTTIYTAITGATLPLTSTIATPSFGTNAGSQAPGTVVIAQPAQYRTIFSLGANITAGLTATLAQPTILSDGSQIPGTISIAQPGSYITSFSLLTGLTAAQTSTVAQPSIGQSNGSVQPGTVIVAQPPAFTTVVSVASGIDTQLLSIAVQPSFVSGLQIPGTVINIQPAGYTVISTVPSTAAASVSAQVVPTLVQPTLPGVVIPGTVVVAQPPAYTTAYTIATGITSQLVSTVAVPVLQAGVQIPGTVIVAQPPTYVTSYTVAPGVTTPLVSTVAQPLISAGIRIPGTVVVASPAAYVTQYTLASAATQDLTTVIAQPSLVSGSQIMGTVIIAAQLRYATIYGIATGITHPLTSSIAQPSLVSNSQIPGTVVVAIPATYTTQHTFTSGALPTLITTIAQPSVQTNGAVIPGTIEIVHQYVYVTSYTTPASAVSTPYTTVLAQPSIGPNGVVLPGTVLVARLLCLGLGYAAYYNPFPLAIGTTYGSGSSPFTAAYFNQNLNTSLTPKWSGTTDNVAFNIADGSTPGALYQQSRVRVNYTAIVYTGLFIAPTTGTFSFFFPGSGYDDIAYLWVGAGGAGPITDWSDTNYNIRAPRDSTGAPSSSYQLQATAGVAYPVVLLWANAAYAAAMSFAVTYPNGTTVASTAGLFSSIDCYTTPQCYSLDYQAFYNPYVPLLGLGYDTSPFSATYFNTNYNSSLTPAWGGSTSSLQLSISDSTQIGPIYQQTAVSISQTAIVYTGYFTTYDAGQYTFTFPNQLVKGIAYFWLGQAGASSISDWNETNYNLRVPFDTTSGVLTNQYTFTTVAGATFPVVFLYANAATGAALSLSITYPDGGTVINPTGVFSNQNCTRAFQQ